MALMGALLLTVANSSTAHLTLQADDFVPGRAWERELELPIPTREIVLSWDARAPRGSSLTFSLRAPGTKAYNMGSWSETESLRRSFNGQKDEQGDVQTDILVLREPTQKIWIRVEPTGDAVLRRVDLSLRNPDGCTRPARGNRSAWGRVIPVPKRNQGAYANGNVICSPTTVSMMLQYWAGVLEQPFLDQDVPLVQSGVFDPEWGGTGNWSFNAAFAARMGLRSFVTRLDSVEEAEQFIAMGVPVVTSVSYDLLKGKPERGENDGHLVILVGFDADGTPVFNDPGRSNQLQHRYERAAFDRAWASSGRTAYVIAPPKTRLPKISGMKW